MATQEGCMLLTKLPVELREVIYELALVPDQPVVIERAPMREWDGCITFGVEPALLAACWKTRHEGSRIFYCGSSFKIDRLSHIKLFLRQLGPGRIQNATMLKLFGYPRERPRPRSESHLEKIRNFLFELADEFAEAGLQTKQIEICTRRSRWWDLPPIWQSIDELKDLKTELGSLAIEKSWGKGWEIEGRGVAKSSDV